MKYSLTHELKKLFPAWLGCILLPLPAFIFTSSDEGVPWLFSCFAVGCAGLVAFAFQPNVRPGPLEEPNRTDRIWNKRLLTVGTALIAADIVFSLFCLIFRGQTVFIAVAKGVYISLLAFFVMPYFMLVTRKFFTAVVLAIMSVFCLKLLGCSVVVLVYGWDASEHGYTTTPWTHPNLLVWLFWSFTAILSASLYFLGERKFYKVYGRAA